jgi:hypothetical protein
MTSLPFDPQNPPEEPPANANPLTWSMAYQIHSDHQPAADGFCVAITCKTRFAFWPCDALALASAGFITAVDRGMHMTSGTGYT